MGRTAVAWGSITAHNLATYSQSELGFSSNFNIFQGCNCLRQTDPWATREVK